MSDKQQFIITVDWGSYAIKYLFITNIIPDPDWADDDERWLSYDESEKVIERFKAWADKSIGGLNGKVVLIESGDFVIADGYNNGN